MAEATAHAHAAHAVAGDHGQVAGARADSHQEHPIRLYLVVWGGLFILSAGSYLVDYIGLQGYLRWTLILLFMVLKAGLIVAVFMHMAWERLAMVYAILLPPVLVLFMALLVAWAIDEPAWVNGNGVLTDGLSLFAVLGAAVGFAAGILLRSYAFDKYKTRKDANGQQAQKKPAKISIQTSDPAGARKRFADTEAVIDGVLVARDLVNEPANMLGPMEFAARASALEALGVKVEVLTEKEMRKLGMGALLGVAQGSPRGARLAVMQWSGGKARDKPVAFVGKGITFDTGGNSMKPASSMEDMKGDMGGAAAVVGLMHALAARKAKANVVGIIGLVENAVDGNSQRPGDIVTSMSGQTIEVLNTDAEGRLVLADALWYCNDRFQPKFMIDLATLTGAILVALGQQHAACSPTTTSLPGAWSTRGRRRRERLWRMPLGPDYDKLIDSKNADMKNIGGRYGGAITAAQFLQRFVKDTPWAHLDIAGTAMSAPSSEINQSWGSGFGVRLLDRLVRDHYEG